MNPAIQYALETSACSAVLLTVYVLLLEQRVPFRRCRIYLLAATAASALIPLLDIPVWPGKAIKAVAVPTVPGIADWSGPEVIAEKAAMITEESIFAVIYIVGVLIITGLIVWQLSKIWRLRRGSEVVRTDRYTLVRTLRETAAFSFLRSIYIWRQTPANELDAIIAHEASHIAHRHSLERVAMEVMKALLWWNPFVWILARKLGEVEEFEADNDVLNSGIDRSEYMETILKQLFGYSPDIANGLRNSLTKKRFRMMTTPIKSKHALLRMAVTLPFVLGLLCAFGFKSRAAAVVSPEPAAVETAANTAPAADTTAGEEPRQTFTKVTLQVLDEQGRNMPGVGAYILDGSDRGVVTGKNGTAMIDVPEGKRLTFIYPGYNKEISEPASGAQMYIELVLKKEDTSLVETGVIIKLDSPEGVIPANGAIIRTVSGEKIEARSGVDGLAKIRTPRNSVIEISYPGYAGRLYAVPESESGIGMTLLPEGKQTDVEGISVRDEYGVKHTPLFLIDGMEAPGRSIDATDIADMSVLTGKEAAKYGERGKYGVVIITTKNGSVNRTTAEYTPEEEESFLFAEVMPQFPTGDPAKPYGDLHAFRTWVNSNVRYPAEALAKGISGRVVVTFSIECDGSLADVKVLQSPDRALSEEAIRTLNTSPKWKPGMQQGQTVRVRYTLPVDFSIKKDPQPATASAPATL